MFAFNMQSPPLSLIWSHTWKMFIEFFWGIFFSRREKTQCYPELNQNYCVIMINLSRQRVGDSTAIFRSRSDTFAWCPIYHFCPNINFLFIFHPSLTLSCDKILHIYLIFLFFIYFFGLKSPSLCSKCLVFFLWCPCNPTQLRGQKTSLYRLFLQTLWFVFPVPN